MKIQNLFEIINYKYLTFNRAAEINKSLNIEKIQQSKMKCSNLLRKYMNFKKSSLPLL